MLIFTDELKQVAPNDHQLQLYKNLNGPDKKCLIDVKGRGLGVTTIIANYIADVYIQNAIMNKPCCILLFAHSDMFSAELRMLKRYIEGLIKIKLNGAYRCKLIYNYLNANRIRVNTANHLYGLSPNLIYTKDADFFKNIIISPRPYKIIYEVSN